MVDMILLDEKAARRVAATRGLVELASAIDRLRMTTFRASPALLKTTLDRFGTR
jgi:hypothetical protein